MKKNNDCTSKQIVIFVEGDTDEVFFKALLDYYKASSQVPLTPCEVINLKGVTRYTSKLMAKLRNEILLRQKERIPASKQSAALMTQMYSKCVTL